MVKNYNKTYKWSIAKEIDPDGIYFDSEGAIRSAYYVGSASQIFGQSLPYIYFLIPSDRASIVEELVSSNSNCLLSTALNGMISPNVVTVSNVSGYLYSGLDSDLEFKPVDGVVNLSQVDKRTKGFKVSETVYALGTDNYSASPSAVVRAFYYDSRGRIIQKVERHPLGGISRYSVKYDYTGNVLQSLEQHEYDAKTDTKESVYTYDHRGRMLSEIVTLNGTAQGVVRYSYNELGQLISKMLGNSSDAVVDSYSYNMQGWLKMQRSTLFTQILNYYEATDNTPSYTGNISSAKWQHLGPRGGTLNTSTYKYDDLGRLKENRIINSSSRVFQEFSYDNNSNVTSTSISDSQKNTYKTLYNDSGRLAAMEEVVQPHVEGAEEIQASYEFNYDDNGNMSYHGKQKKYLKYNYLNLLSAVRSETSSSLSEYVWLADGTKAYTTENGNVEFIYRGSLEYVNENIETGFSSGKLLVNATSGGTTTLYHIKDHLGSVRVVFANNGNNIYARNDYYSFGERLNNSLYDEMPYKYNRHQFNGKECQITGQTMFLDYGARMYDPDLYCWLSPDPKAEKYYSFSPYNYCLNNPVIYVDNFGLDIRHFTVDALGYVRLVKIIPSTQMYDVLFSSSYYSFSDSAQFGLIVHDTTILPQLTMPRSNYPGHYAVSTSKSDMFNIFYFMSSNTEVEWALQGWNKKGKDYYSLATTHKEDEVKMLDYIPEYGLNINNLRFTMHNHKETNDPSGADFRYANSRNQDRPFQNGFNSKDPLPEDYLYFSKDNEIRKYQSHSKGWLSPQYSGIAQTVSIMPNVILPNYNYSLPLPTYKPIGAYGY